MKPPADGPGGGPAPTPDPPPLLPPLAIRTANFWAERMFDRNCFRSKKYSTELFFARKCFLKKIDPEHFRSKFCLGRKCVWPKTFRPKKLSTENKFSRNFSDEKLSAQNIFRGNFSAEKKFGRKFIGSTFFESFPNICLEGKFF